MGKITWRERLAISPHLRSLNNWPVIDQNSLPAGKRQLFHQRRSIVAQVLVDMCVTNAAERHAMSPSAVSRLMNRALGGQEDQPPALTYALVPYHRLSSPIRRSPLPTLTRPGGCANAFNWLLLNAPALRETLDRAIVKDLRMDRDAQRLTPQTFHKLFKYHLNQVSWSQDTYPFSQLDVAYESCRQYLHARRAHLK